MGKTSLVMSLASGHQAVLLEGEELAKQMKDWTGYPDGLVRLTPGRWLFPAAYMKFGDKLYNFKFRPTDTMVATWPKCGTTWTQEIVWTMINNPDVNNDKAELPMSARSPYIEMDMLIEAHLKPDMKNNSIIKAFNKLCPGKNPADGVTLQMGEATPDPRLIKTHIPFSLLSPSLLDTTKVVLVARNPKDTVVSYYHYSRLMHMHGFVGPSIDDFVQYFLDDDLVFGPYWLFLKEGWERRHHPNLHFIFYEDLKADNMGELRKLNKFLGTNLTEDQLKNVAKQSSFDEMRARSACFGGRNEDQDLFKKHVVKEGGEFFRKGETGDWKEKLSPELAAKIDDWTQKNLGDLCISFKYSV